ncbi:MAG: hypothetical protein QMC67_11575 [Candidatus Wallbacteria bacterium]
MEFKSLKKILIPAVSITTSAILLLNSQVVISAAEELKKDNSALQTAQTTVKKEVKTEKTKKAAKKKKKKAVTKKKAKQTKKSEEIKPELIDNNVAAVTASPQETQETQIKKSGKETGASVVFVLMEKKQAVVTDLLDVLLLFKNIPLEEKNTDQKISALRNLGIIKPDMTIDPKLEVRKGFAALLFYNAMGLKGGLTLRIAGPSTRNCFRELVYEKIMPESSERDKMTGPELVSLLQKAKEKMTAGEHETISSNVEGR